MAREVTLRVPGLYPHQQRLDEAPQPFKLARWGRRAGKTVWIFRAAVMGHGPLGADGEPIHKGLRHGKDVVWVGRSKDQARTIWNNEVRPRFEATGVANINDTLFTATMPGFGKLIVKSQDRDSISNVRGMGDTIGGVVGDEVAHWDDAESAWLDVLLPVLTDNLGWFAAVSTTEPGSWFNRQCADIMAGNKPVNTWFHTHATALDNPRISPVAFDRLLAEYPQGDPRARRRSSRRSRWVGRARAAHPRESACMVPPLGSGHQSKRNAHVLRERGLGVRATRSRSGSTWSRATGGDAWTGCRRSGAEPNRASFRRRARAARALRADVQATWTTRWRAGTCLRTRAVRSG
jgi:hypothetical protein